MNGFSRSVGRAGAPLHCAAHSHHPWPDVSCDAHLAAWDDAARMLDRKWDHVFDTVIPKAQAHVARQLNLPDPTSVTFGPNTHGFVLRLLSCLPAHRPARILTTGSEFLSFARQIARLEEDRLVQVTRIPTEPFDTFEARFAEAAREGSHDLVFLSQVFFDSGFRLNALAEIVNAVPEAETLIAVDGYHGFMAVPTDFSALAGRAFYLAGGYKFAMSGENACFLHCPPGYGPRPRDTGWYAGFSALGSGGGTAYAKDGSRFLGSTFDVSGLYRFNAVQDWLTREDMSVAKMLEYGRGIEGAFLAALGDGTARVRASQSIVPDANRRGRFLAFRTKDAGAIAAELNGRDVIVDHRGDRLRIGFGIYHAENDAMRMAEALAF